MTTGGATGLPAITCARTSTSERGNVNVGRVADEISTYLANAGLHCMAERPPRPGEVFKRPVGPRPSNPRPLGLIPDRRREIDSHFVPLPPIFVSQNVGHGAFPFRHGGETELDSRADDSCERLYRHHEAGRGGGVSVRARDRLHLPSATSNTRNDDEEYVDTLAKCTMQDYRSEVNVDAMEPRQYRRLRSKLISQMPQQLLFTPMRYVFFHCARL